MPTIWNNDDIEKLKELCETKNNREIVEAFNNKYTIKQIQNKEENLGIKPLPIYFGDPNPNFFKSIDTKEKAYILGYWVADGYLAKEKNSYKVGFSSNDLDLLKNVRKHIGDFSGKHIHRHGERNYQYNIYSYSLYTQLQNLGFDNKKSYTAIYPKIPHKFNSHFIRGVLDGDGCIYIDTQNNAVALEFSGTEVLLSGISKCFNNVKLYKREHTYSCYRLKIYGKKAIPVLNYIYRDSEDLRLERKYEKYKEALLLYQNKMNIPKSIIHEHCKESIKK